MISRVLNVIFLLFVVSSSLIEVTTGDYTVNPDDGIGYKVMYHALSWSRARDSCESIGAKLAVPKSKEQFEFMQKIVRRMHYPSIVGTRYKLLVWLGISNDHRNSTWINVDGENIGDTGFHTWASGDNGLASDNPREPHCVGMDAANIGLRDWWCHLRQPYICQMQIQPMHES